MSVMRIRLVVICLAGASFCGATTYGAAPTIDIELKECSPGSVRIKGSASDSNYDLTELYIWITDIGAEGTEWKLVYQNGPFSETGSMGFDVPPPGAPSIFTGCQFLQVYVLAIDAQGNWTGKDPQEDCGDCGGFGCEDCDQLDAPDLPPSGKLPTLPVWGLIGLGLLLVGGGAAVFGRRRTGRMLEG